MPITTSKTGEKMETLAEEYLRSKGLSSITRNFRCPGGEIDLVMRDADTLVFIEVRYRRSNSFGGAAESITARKQARILLAAERFLLCNPSCNHNPCRFDVVAIEGRETAPKINWIPDAFQISDSYA